ncbi:MAG: hypothetical protein K0R15_59 [Clostridiales bacterium]|jgi:hypothetical protein|nr:hypothetical protein [Clostridiales bacterium]
MFKKIKKAIHNFLLQIAQENEKTYGNEKMDCCKLNNTKSK